jgi:hypothetical protein
MRRLVAGSVLVIVLAGCSGATSGTAPKTAPSTSSPASATAAEVDGTFDVGDYALHMTCKGTGSPTVVFFDGLGGGSSAQVTAALAPRLTDRHRFCAYDRVNTGRSETQQAMHTGADSVRDLHALMAEANDVDKQMQALRAVKQAEFVNLLKQGRLVQVKSSHDIVAEQPEIVVAEMQRIVAAS